MLCGILWFRRKKYFFSIENNLLRLMRENIEPPGLIDFSHRDSNPLHFNNNYFKGLLLPGNEIIIIKPAIKYFSFFENSYSCEVEAFFVLERKCKINGLSIHTPELDNIYNYHKAVDSADFSVDGDIKIEIKGFKESTEYFNNEVFYKGKTVNPSFRISRTITYNKMGPFINLATYLFLEFEPTDDIQFVERLFFSSVNFIRYLCYRQNILVKTLNLYSKVNDHTRKIGYAKIFDKFSPEPSMNALRKRFIPSDYLEDKKSNVFQDILDGRVNLRNLPESDKVWNLITPGSFLMITSTFEGEFDRLFPDFHINDFKTIATEVELKQILDEVIKVTKGEVRGKIKEFRNSIGKSYLKQKVIKMGGMYPELITHLVEPSYRFTGKTFVLKDVAERLREQRNVLAHGNLIHKFNPTVLLDIRFLERLTYYMQLRNWGISEKSSLSAINSLFDLGRIIDFGNTNNKV